MSKIKRPKNVSKHSWKAMDRSTKLWLVEHERLHANAIALMRGSVLPYIVALPPTYN